MFKSPTLLAIAGFGGAVALALATSPAMADTATGTLTVNATVEASCSIDNATLDFGNIADLGTDTDASQGLKVTCTKNTDYSIAMDEGQNGSGNGSSITRAMSDGTDQLSYQLYTDSSRNNVWEDSCASPATGTDCAYGTGTGTQQTNITVYGRVPANQNVEAGSYTDTVTMTVTF